MNEITRRGFLATATASIPAAAAIGGVGAGGVAAAGNGSSGLGAGGLGGLWGGGQPIVAKGPKGPVVISSSNGMRTVAKAAQLISEGHDPATAIVEGVAIVEEDPSDHSVGLGGLPNEDGVVTLDASVMHGPSGKAGAVASLEDVVNAARVALTVLRRTDHCLLVGPGAKRFALAHGFPETNLLTEDARAIWMKWKENRSKDDDWLNEDERDDEKWREPRKGAGLERGVEVEYTTGTIHCSAVNTGGDLASCTTTSGLSFKIPGRVGDSPIVGAGMYCDNDVGAAGATGRGEACIQNCAAHAIVSAMERGVAPGDACLGLLKKMSDRTREKRLKRADGKPAFSVTVYALRKDGAFGSATMFKGDTFSVWEAGAAQAKLVECAYLYEK